jgi:lipopolysaccharide/colanic/teichoic acid biosynthesis glycosyltransferase
MTLFQRTLKRTFDLLAAFLGLLFTLPIILVLALLVFLETHSNGFYSDIRIGRHGKPFRIYKIRSMRPAQSPPHPIVSSPSNPESRIPDMKSKSKLKSKTNPQFESRINDSRFPNPPAGEAGPESTTSVITANNPRITKIGRFLRKTKLDELPQLWNVLLGNMSFVGPRPDVPGFADKLQGEDRIVLSIRPGITGPASLAFRNEEELLAQQENPEQYNREIIWPEKVRINKEYIRNYSLWLDIKIIWKTVFS